MRLFYVDKNVVCCTVLDTQQLEGFLPSPLHWPLLVDMPVHQQRIFDRAQDDTCTCFEIVIND